MPVDPAHPADGEYEQIVGALLDKVNRHPGTLTEADLVRAVVADTLLICSGVLTVRNGRLAVQ